ncbi:MAG: hypothetical protein HGA87_02930 [Desulfobulbaceae bacterium]|nr:hypothetical protein [Desulfobulbaceae bacterium]
MGFLEKIFGRNNQIEPFPENQSDAEKLSWFQKTQPWGKVDEKIINAIVEKYKGNPMIVVFVVTSMRHNLIPMYCKYNNAEYIESPEIICSLIAQILYNLGSSSLKKMIALTDSISANEEKFKLHCTTVMDSLESCIILSDNHVFAYFGLAMAHSVLNNSEGILKYAKQGLVAIKKIRENNIPFHLSTNEDIKNSIQTLEEIENRLNRFIKETKNV